MIVVNPTLPCSPDLQQQEQTSRLLGDRVGSRPETAKSDMPDGFIRPTVPTVKACRYGGTEVHVSLL